MLINSSPIVGLIRGFKIAHIAGRFGGGKTALAYRLAYELLAYHGYRYLLSNCADVWRDDLQDVVLRENDRGEPQFMDAVIILDEAGLVLGSGAQAKKYVAFMRKANVVLLLPSVEPPPSRVRFLQIQRRWDLGVLGLPVWHYEARLNTGMGRDKYQFTWLFPSEIFGIYDTHDFPADDGGIGDLLENYVEGQVKRSAKKRGVERVTIPALEESGGDAAGWVDAAEEIRDALSLFADEGQQRWKRR